jgi:GNAT superfamily N-acetyltransferase
MELDTPSDLSVHPAALEDSSRIATLCGQLGYPRTNDAVEAQLRNIMEDKTRQVYVAKATDDLVIGWVEVLLRSILVLDSAAEIGGLVVDEAYRGSGAGRLLMEQAERWAHEHGCWQVYLRSNIVREDAHRFYKRIGYDNHKTQFTFRKAL